MVATAAIRIDDATRTARLRADRTSVAHGDTPILHELDVEIRDGAITSIIGPNGCGKSTLLRAMARLIRPQGGAVVLDGQMIHRMPTKDVARRLGLLSQQASAPDGITVEDLVRRGRYPHQSLLQPQRQQDVDAIERALKLTGLQELRRSQVDQLSGGQRQRAWIAMVLAQETPLLLLDEPTTYLDLAHQIETLDLVRSLNRDENRTIVMVLHDVNEAMRVSDRIVAIKAGKVIADGEPDAVVDARLLHELYDAPCDLLTHPDHRHRVCIPRAKQPVADRAPRRAAASGAPGLDVERLCVSYGDCAVLRSVNLAIPAGAVTAIVGPNACGKSTLLRTCACLLSPESGCARLDGRDVRANRRRAFAQRVAMLNQRTVPPAGMLVEDLVAFGRMPHQRLLRQWRKEDEAAVERALARCGLLDLRLREAVTLSGGQLQRAWIAMVLAQDTPVLLLDEPTSFLDLGAQIDLLELAAELNREDGRTVAMVLHDLNLAARYADWIVAMRDGDVVAAGSPDEVITPDIVRQVFGVDATILRDPGSGAPMVIAERAAARNR